MLETNIGTPIQIPYQIVLKKEKFKSAGIDVSTISNLVTVTKANQSSLTFKFNSYHFSTISKKEYSIGRLTKK